MTVTLCLPGGDGEALRLDGERLELVSPTAFAPGQPVSFEAAVGEGLKLDGRAIGSKKRPDGRFDVRLRLVSLSRDARERLSQALSSPSA